MGYKAQSTNFFQESEILGGWLIVHGSWFMESQWKSRCKTPASLLFSMIY